jgi:hypothetical protein
VTTATGAPTLTDYITAVLEGLNKPVSNLNIAVLSGLAMSEGRGLSGFNPFDTTQAEAGSTNFNSAGVKSYPSFQEGVAAAVATLNNGLYDPLLTGLQEQQPFSFYVSGPGFTSLKNWQRGPHGASNPPPAAVNVLSSRSQSQLLAYANSVTTTQPAGSLAGDSKGGGSSSSSSSSSGPDPFGIGALTSAISNIGAMLVRVAAVGVGFAIFVVGLFLIFGGDIEKGIDKVSDVAEKVAPAALA